MKHELNNITYNLVKMEKALVFQILEQDESWTGEFTTEKYNKKYPRNAGNYDMCIKSVSVQSDVQYSRSPSISFFINYRNHLSISLRGSDKRHNWDFRVCVQDDYKNNKIRDYHYKIFKKILKEWDLHVSKLKKEKK